MNRLPLLTMKKKVRLEFFDRAGTKHTIAIEGDVTPEKVRRLLEYAEIVAGTASSSTIASEAHETKMNRLLDVINTRLADRSFDSREIWQAYRESWGDDFALGGVSTYLSRLVDRGTLQRTGSSSHWMYRLKPSQTLSQ